MIIKIPNAETTAKATLKSVASDSNPMRGGPIINPRKLTDETTVMAILAAIVFNLPAML